MESQTLCMAPDATSRVARAPIALVESYIIHEIAYMIGEYVTDALRPRDVGDIPRWRSARRERRRCEILGGVIERPNSR